MSKQFSADSEEKGTRGNSKQAQLLVLLLLLAAFAYLYFFTGVIKPRQEAAKSPEQAVLVKKPMPPRAEQKQVATGEQALQQKPVSPAKTPDLPSAQTVAAPKTATIPVPAKQEQVKTLKKEDPVKQKAPVKNEPLKVAKKQEPATSTKQSPVAAEKIAQSKTKQVVAPAGHAAAPAKQGPKSATAADRSQHKSGDKKDTDAFYLKIGEFPLVKDVAAVEAKLKKAGINPVIRQKITKIEPMHRLFYAEHSDRESAAVDLEQLRSKAPDAFVIQENEKFVVYAGSYFKEDRGAIELERLFDKGIKLAMKKSNVKIPVIQLGAGRFASHNDASTAAAMLKKSGINATVTKKAANK